MQTLLCIVLGALAPLVLDAPPGVLWPAFLALAICAMSLRRSRRLLVLFLVPCGWTLWQVQGGLDQRWSGPGETFTLQGTVASLPERRPDLLQFLMEPDAPLPGQATTGMVLVRWYQPTRAVRAGQRWALQVGLKPPRGRVNFSGPDTEKSLFADGVAALAVVRGQGGALLSDAPGWPGLHGWRDSVRMRLVSLLEPYPGAELILSLAIADRSGLSRELRESVRVTGTGHLLAISGMHVGLVALFGYLLGRWLFGPLLHAMLGCAPLPVSWLLGMSGAVAYSALAGFGTSTQRALVMLCVPLGALMLRRNIKPLLAWLLALAAVMLIDPLAPLRAGFWLSFGAVAVLLFLFLPRTGRRGRIGRMLTAQAGISLAMLPLGMHWFQQLTAGGLLANIAAIPWVSLITLPLTMGGLALLPIDSGVAEILLQMASRSAHWAIQALSWAADVMDPLHRLTARPGLALVSAAMLGAALLMLPRAYGFWLLGCVLYAPVMLNPEPAPRHGGVSLDMLDVGQGLAVLARTRQHMLMYDSGPGIPGQWDLYDGVLAPAMAQAGRVEPDRIVISHGDLDHAGGLASLRTRFEDARLLASLPPGRARLPKCHAGRSWIWDAVQFEALHPSAHLPYLGNDSSCVIGIRAPGASVLLPGDIGLQVERRLSRESAGGYDLLLAPHHGSRTSTGADLLAWARPRIVLVSAGAGNRFGFPHPSVMGRIQAAGAAAWSTSECGGIRVRIDPDGRMAARSARRERGGFWRWPAAPECP